MRPPEYRVRVGRRATCLLWVVAAIAGPCPASPLFESASVLEVRLSGPLGTVIGQKKQADRPEYPFVLTVDGATVPVDVRVRGRSRIVACPFPPLRLDFARDAAANTVFAGQDKLKLVTHCRSNSDVFENNVLDEYAAYRMFNLLSDASYRVRLLRIHYDDADAEQNSLERPYYGFLIESDVELARRLGGTVAEVPGVRYSLLDVGQTALVYVFQYLISNVDWSFVQAADAETCCHNIDLVDVDGRLYAIPYDFDFSGFVDAGYARVPDEIRAQRVTQRVYRGYCKQPADSLGPALDIVLDRKAAILDLAGNLPVAGGRDTASRTSFIARFFEQAKDAEKLLRKFDDACVGPR